MILPFNKSWFVVTFTGECPESKLIKGWENVLNHIDKEMGNKEPDMAPEVSVHHPCCELHDEDNWGLLGSCYMNNDDERHTFSTGEFGYCVGLQIVRITEPVVIPAEHPIIELQPIVNCDCGFRLDCSIDPCREVECPHCGNQHVRKVSR